MKNEKLWRGEIQNAAGSRPPLILSVAKDPLKRAEHMVRRHAEVRKTYAVYVGLPEASRRTFYGTVLNTSS